MERRGFLRGLISMGPLALLVQPGLSATPDLVDKQAIWTPQPPAIVPSTGALMIQVSRWGYVEPTPILSLVISDRGAFHWQARPGTEIMDVARNKLIWVSVVTHVSTPNGYAVTGASGNTGELTHWYQGLKGSNGHPS